ncbi:dihydrofolate reductase family protein [Persicitalea jodogahamensis]|uniref:Dihydrofolate reductase n=1 Tax=Persicitalea jodogahamensis TaxID=402147 RepID=A0A8J3D311_9BACT|nr:dihydrofolate reductase family protein [Persicitalea jodogahamensis]GHB62260.1 dihydrofolate reductase [Persicitalea jodogahamensis]
MKDIVYYVASSLDGFISGPDDDISGFVPEGSGVQQYLKDLATFESVIMGRKTYEFGYAYGLKPGRLAYPHMEHFIFSDHLTFDEPDPRLHVKPLQLDEIEKIREEAKTDVYLCGGGQFAGWLLDNQKIDVLKIKLNPLILGKGVRLFGDSEQNLKTELVDSKTYEGGLQIITYRILY